MNQPRRFKAAPALGLEGRLMAIGSEEIPESEAIHRVARGLGISATVIASTAVAAAMAPSATAATASASAGAIGTVGTAVGKVTGSFLATTIFKATVIGLSLGIASFTGVKLIRSRAPANEASVTAKTKVERQLPTRTRDSLGVAPSTSVFQDQVPGTASTRALAASSAIPGGPTVIAAPAAPGDSPSLAAAPVARFEDLESPAAIASNGPNSTASLASQGPVTIATAAPRAGAFPVDPRLAREVASLDHVRATAARGDAAGALRELNAFEKGFGYFALRKEAMLVNIDVLLSLGQRSAAAATARQLLLMGAPANQRARLEELVRSQP